MLVGNESAEKRRLLSNIFSLGILQGANYILPLLTIPYLVRVLGPDYYGLIAFSAATVTYFSLITDYGFNLSATRQISINRGDPEKVIEIFSSVMTVKFILLVTSFSILVSMILLFDRFSNDYLVYLYSFGIVVGQYLFPTWLFQGMEKMTYVAVLNILSKGIFTIFVFILVDSQLDYKMVPLLTSTGAIVAGILALVLVRYHLGLHFRIPSLRSVQDQFVDGWHIFSSSISISMYTNSVPFLLGIYTNNETVGVFSAAEKIIQAVKGLYQPVVQAIFPLISSKINNDMKAGLVYVKRISHVMSSFMFLVCAALYFYADYIVGFILGEQYVRSVILLEIMAFLPFIIILSNMYGVQTMVNIGHKAQFSRILIAAAIIGLILSTTLVPRYESIGASFVVLLIEILVTLSMAVYLWRKL